MNISSDFQGFNPPQNGVSFFLVKRQEKVMSVDVFQPFFRETLDIQVQIFSVFFFVAQECVMCHTSRSLEKFIPTWLDSFSAVVPMRGPCCFG